MKTRYKGYLSMKHYLLVHSRENEGKFSIEGNTLSVSFGCSTMTGENNLKRYIGMADHNMYEEKEAKKRR